MTMCFRVLDLRLVWRVPRMTAPGWRPAAGKTVFGAAALLAGLAAPGSLLGQTPSQSVNMVSGTTLPGGDPFLQRQNEPSLAVSTRNPQHLLAGANDYRTVDLPGLPADEETGDSWAGLFASLDGGETWRSTLVPGYPQDTSPEGLASPLKGLTAAADPVVRAGSHGLFYYGLIAFDRERMLGRLAVARFVDLNDREDGDIASGTSPIRYAGTSIVDSGNSGQFIDKPWLAVDVPRPGARTCLIPTSPGQSIPGGIVYVAWARFTGRRSTKVMLSRSLDCGATWSRPTKLSESDSINQGLTMAIDPASGGLYVAWRRLAAPNQPDAIVFTRSNDFGQHFTRARVLVPAGGREFVPFDQSGDPAQVPYRTVFRTTAYPTLAVSVDGSGRSRVHVAWAQRMAPRGDARIVLSTSGNGGATWSDPSPVDASPLQDGFGGSFDRGHQFMPQMTSSAGRLMVLYYDTRLDHTRGILTPGPGLGDPSGAVPLYQEQREPQGELETPGGSTGAALVFTPVVDDAQPPLEARRHTIDVRVAQLDLRQLVDSGALLFTSARVSQYPFGVASTQGVEDAGDVLTPPAKLEQLKFNPPNLPLFAKGTTPFVGDYIDIAGLDFVRDPAGEWRFNTQGASAPVFHAAWTSNEDVRPPPDGDWTSYTPPGKAGCVPGREGMRNQNVYAGRITQGLVVSSPQTAKPLKPYVSDDPTSVRTFVVEVQNLTNESRSFRLRIVGQPAGGQASFLPPDGGAPPRETRDTLIPSHSGFSQTVFATSVDPAATIHLEVAEITGAGGDLVAGGLGGFVVLNADPTVPLLQNLAARGTPVEAETYTPRSRTRSPTRQSRTRASPTRASPTRASRTRPSRTRHLQPVHLEPAHLQPVHLQPVHLQPVDREPVHLEPQHLQPLDLQRVRSGLAPLRRELCGHERGQHVVFVPCQARGRRERRPETPSASRHEGAAQPHERGLRPRRERPGRYSPRRGRPAHRAPAGPVRRACRRAGHRRRHVCPAPRGNRLRDSSQPVRPRPGRGGRGGGGSRDHPGGRAAGLGSAATAGPGEGVTSARRSQLRPLPASSSGT